MFEIVIRPQPFPLSTPTLSFWNYTHSQLILPLDTGVITSVVQASEALHHHAREWSIKQNDCIYWAERSGSMVLLPTLAVATLECNIIYMTYGLYALLSINPTVETRWSWFEKVGAEPWLFTRSHTVYGISLSKCYNFEELRDRNRKSLHNLIYVAAYSCQRMPKVCCDSGTYWHAAVGRCRLKQLLGKAGFSELETWLEHHVDKNCHL